MARRWRGAPFVLGSFVAAATLACVTEASVKKSVAQHAYCPEERLVVKERPDVDALTYAADMAFFTSASAGADRQAPAETSGAPADVAADPERLAYWRETQVALWRSLMRDRTVYEVTGCGIHNLTACRQEKWVACSWLPKEVAIARGQLSPISP